jgi:Ca-activated chloride channel family protein
VKNDHLPAWLVGDINGKPSPRHRSRSAWTVAVLLAVTAVAIASVLGVRARSRGSRGPITIVLDVSNSMGATDLTPTRFGAAVAAVETNLRRSVNRPVGLVIFATKVEVRRPPGAERDLLLADLHVTSPHAASSTGDALTAALDDLPRGGSVLLLADGAQNVGSPLEDALGRAAAGKTKVNTVAIGRLDGHAAIPQGDGTTKALHVPPDREAMEQAAAATGGRFWVAESTKTLAKAVQQALAA